MSGERAVTLVVEREPVTVLVVGDVRLYREALATSLRDRPALKVVGVASTVEEVLSIVAGGVPPQVTVVDVAMRNSLWMIRALREQVPMSRVVAFAIEEVDREILLCAEAGVSGYVSSDGTLDDLVSAVECAARGEFRCSPKTAAVLLHRVASLSATDTHVVQTVPLTAREREIAGLIEKGLSNKQIAGRLCIEVATVKNHVHNILDKLNVSTRGEAVARLRRDAHVPSLRQLTQVDVRPVQPVS